MPAYQPTYLLFIMHYFVHFPQQEFQVTLQRPQEIQFTIDFGTILLTLMNCLTILPELSESMWYSYTEHMYTIPSRQQRSTSFVIILIKIPQSSYCQYSSQPLGQLFTQLSPLNRMVGIFQLWGCRAFSSFRQHLLITPLITTTYTFSARLPKGRKGSRKISQHWGISTY